MDLKTYRWIFATGNQDKVREIRQMLPWNVISMKEAGIDLEIVEDGKTFAENALIKARALHAYLKERGQEEKTIVMADDSGLEIDALNGEPGIYSARYLGHDTPYTVKNQNFLDRMKGVPDEKRTARYICAIATVLPDGEELQTEAALEGRIAYQSAGSNGFGFDPILYLPQYGKTSAEISVEEKNAISHRGKALQKMKILLEEHR